METIRLEHVTFSYPLAERNALEDVSFAIDESQFVVLCGKSGCGKSTLLRQLKKPLIPYGKLSGRVLYEGTPIRELDDRRGVSEIGFVQQNPDNQLVTDKVWHELAFGLESLGLDNASIKRRVAEMASYFNIQEWFRKSVNQLSGGQKQLLNLASVMAMQPKMLILDEPTSQLDPIAASEFLQTVRRLNRDLGVTVFISEHRLEELFPMADKVMVMDEGKILAYDGPRRIGDALAGTEGSPPHPMFYGLPSVMRIFAEACPGEAQPLTIREGRLQVERMVMKNPDRQKADASAQPSAAETLGQTEKADAGGGPAQTIDGNAGGGLAQAVGENADGGSVQTVYGAAGGKPVAGQPEYVIELRDVWFRYRRDSGDVLRGLRLRVPRDSWYCLLGGNGTGKSTTLKIIAGILKAQRGEIRVDRDILGMLPQNPQALFTEITCEEELMEALYGMPLRDAEKITRVEAMLDQMEISHLRKANPYDLSGGEQQRLALGKILLLDPRILLLDEPTKGLDPFFKRTLAGVLRRLTRQGVTILMVSHDIEFCAEYGDLCAMFFDGDIVAEGSPREFFSGNSFYTTTANRIARSWKPDAITCEEVAQWLKSMK